MSNVRDLKAGFVYDPKLRDEAHRLERNYWYEYLREILDRMGLTAEPVEPEMLGRPGDLGRFCTLFLGVLADPGPTKDGLAAWVRDGGTLIGFGTEGLDGLFGNRPGDRFAQPAGPFSIAGYLDLVSSPLTEGIHSSFCPEQKLMVISDARPVRPAGSEEVARFFGPPLDGRRSGEGAVDSDLALITARRLGMGYAFYFGFDLPQTMWTLHQGRPVDADHDGDGYLRFGDAILIGDNRPEVAYTDELLFLLMNMVGRRPHPLIHTVPPRNGEVADALFFFGGDDECAPGTQVSASDFMRSRGLPYHINLMPKEGAFAISEREFRRIEENDHEPSLHYNFIDDFEHPSPFSQKDVEVQSDLYYRTFGRRQVCTVNHWCRWCGWTEPARWMLDAGGKADNSRIHWGSPPLNPVDRIGFSFGTAFPYFFWDDFRGENRRIPFLQEPIVAYEVGYDGEATDFDRIHQTVDLAAQYHLTMNMFYHPVHIHHRKTCRAAIDELLRYVGDQGVRAVYMGNDGLWAWWSARSEARIEDVLLGGDELRFRARCGYADGFLVRIPLGDRDVSSAVADGQTLPVECRREFGQRWAFMPLPGGESEVRVGLT